MGSITVTQNSKWLKPGERSHLAPFASLRPGGSIYKRYGGNVPQHMLDNMNNALYGSHDATGLSAGSPLAGTGGVAPGGPTGMPQQSPLSMQSQMAGLPYNAGQNQYSAQGTIDPNLLAQEQANPKFSTGTPTAPIMSRGPNRHMGSPSPEMSWSSQLGIDRDQTMAQLGVRANARPGQGYTYSGIGPEGNSVFQDPATGESFTYPASQGQGLTPGQSTGLPQPQTPQTGLVGSEQALQQGLRAGTGAIDRALEQGRGDITSAAQGANSTLRGYYEPGRQSNQYQAALSGALGGSAQQQAMDRFMGSPGQQYLLDQSERAITRNAAATGGLGSGNVLRELQQNAIGLAAQDFDNAFNRLGTVSDRGLAAGGQIAGNQMATGNALAGLTADAGNVAAQMAYGTGNNMAQGRTRAGERIAGNIEGTTSNLAEQMYGQGRDMANVIGQGGSNLAQLLAGAGQNMSAFDQNYANLLAQISSNLGANLMGMPGIGNTTTAPDRSAGIGNAISGVGAVLGGGGLSGLGAALSDRRLKSNIEQIGALPSGIPLYRWEWNDKGRQIAGNQPTVGVMADEVPSEYVVTGADGYKRVNYRELLNGI